ncbi:MAG: site-specific integrase [Cohaesibacteraceae bacterium]|nr:site-specific integrase [Cohaesibacteraceae bacterium]MBL4876268.1 site-specific integrase [Cohaesibacteraceae bacterium]
MGTITSRKRKDNSTAYSAQISIMSKGKIVHREAKTFDRRKAAELWIANREDELNTPGGLEFKSVSQAPLSAAIESYIGDYATKIGRTKLQCLNVLKRDYPVASKLCAEIKPKDIVELAKQLSETKGPSTVQNYLSHLGAVFTIAQHAWDYPLNNQTVRDAMSATKRLGLTAKSRSRDRRPTLDELGRLLSHFAEKTKRHNQSIPMKDIVLFALFSTRRLHEITSIKWDDLEIKASRVLVRDMKNPGEKIGNNVYCDIPEPALAVILQQQRTDAEIFPYNHRSISASFTRACRYLAIEDLRFHDLRHDGVSRLFEMGSTIPRAACVSGHRSWSSLQRYTHILQSGDKYAEWPWMPLKPVETHNINET